MKKRQTSDEEKALFEAVISGRVRISRPRRVAELPQGKRRTIQPKVPTGINGQTEERLMRGDLRPEATLDLHGMTESVAFHALVSFIEGSARRGLRLVLVVTGKGTHRLDPYAPFDMELDMRSRGVLREMVPRWLSEPPLVNIIADIRHAHGRHGGTGAVYVYLRKRKNVTPRVVPA